ncbi:hypothetical protein EDB85DRAFT_2144475 [Lactarius pseudohatsudake]|nr:hypothetical protein EDB85DRAFT_2144475 [Lactarius pseudohatsudake]
MSTSVPPTQLPPQPSPPPPGFTQSQASVLGPGVAGLFIQGIESGLVIAQFSQWFAALDRSESSVITTIVIFVTVVGLYVLPDFELHDLIVYECLRSAQSGISFASAWSKYVQHFGMFLLPAWEDNVHSIPTLVIAVPVQALMIQRCYHLVDKNMFIIASGSARHREYAELFLTQTPLVLLLVSSIAVTLWSIVSILRLYTIIVAKNPLILLHVVGISWPFLMSVLLPSVLDLILSGILLHYLTQTMKQVYAPRGRRRISRLVNIVWQSALPPTLCAVCLSALYIQYATSRQKQLQLWMPVIQQMIGKLYVLSLFHMTNVRPLGPDERLTTIISTLTVPADIVSTFTREARGRDADVPCSDIAAERGMARTVDLGI